MEALCSRVYGEGGVCRRTIPLHWGKRTDPKLPLDPDAAHARFRGPGDPFISAPPPKKIRGRAGERLWSTGRRVRYARHSSFCPGRDLPRLARRGGGYEGWGRRWPRSSKASGWSTRRRRRAPAASGRLCRRSRIDGIRPSRAALFTFTVVLHHEAPRGQKPRGSSFGLIVVWRLWGPRCRTPSRLVPPPRRAVELPLRLYVHPWSQISRLARG